MDLNQIFREIFAEDFEIAQHNFLRSLVGYSLLTYILKIKDRHNGNILLDAHGHIIHIDFGFMLSNSPGNWDFESAPFKLTEVDPHLTQEYIEILDGYDSNMFNYFKVLMLQGLSILRKHSEEIINILNIMSVNSPFPCFKKFDLGSVHASFGCSMADSEREAFISQLIDSSLNSTKTYLYDTYQKYTNDIEA